MSKKPSVFSEEDLSGTFVFLLRKILFQKFGLVLDRTRDQEIVDQYKNIFDCVNDLLSSIAYKKAGCEDVTSEHVKSAVGEICYLLKLVKLTGN